MPLPLGAPIGELAVGQTSEAVTGVALVATEAADIFAANLGLPIDAQFAGTEASDTFFAVVSPPTTLSAVLNVHEAADTFAGGVVLPTVQLDAALAATEAPDAFVAAVADPDNVVLAASETPDAMSASIAAAPPRRIGALVKKKYQTPEEFNRNRQRGFSRKVYDELRAAQEAAARAEAARPKPVREAPKKVVAAKPVALDEDDDEEAIALLLG
jgi:hypothetical protein